MLLEQLCSEFTHGLFGSQTGMAQLVLAVDVLLNVYPVLEVQEGGNVRCDVLLPLCTHACHLSEVTL